MPLALMNLRICCECVFLKKNIGWLANLCQLRGRKLAQLAEDGQRDTMHITLRYRITM